MSISAPAPTAPLIELENVTVVRNGNVALDALTLSVPEGQNVAILGPNGSGKSTLIKLITRECYPAFGIAGSALRIFGESTWGVFELRARLGIVSQNLLRMLDEEITGREMILSGFFSSVGIWQCHKVTPQMEQRAKAILERLEVAHLRDRLVTEMSSGEAHRMLIGRALVHHPPSLLLDEPTNSLDPRARRELTALLRKLIAEGTRIVMVTHHLHDILPEMDRVVMLRQGTVFRDGSKPEVLTPENLSALFGMPVEMQQRDGFYHLW